MKISIREWILFCRCDNAIVSVWLRKGHSAMGTLRRRHEKIRCQLHENQGKAYFKKSNPILQRSWAGMVWNILKSQCHWKMWESSEFCNPI